MTRANDGLGYVDTENDCMYVMDDYGDLISVSFCLFQEYFQEH